MTHVAFWVTHAGGVGDNSAFLLLSWHPRTGYCSSVRDGSIYICSLVCACPLRTRQETLISRLNLIIAATRKVHLLARRSVAVGRLCEGTWQKLSNSRVSSERKWFLCVNLYRFRRNPPQNERFAFFRWFMATPSTFALNSSEMYMFGTGVTL